MLKKLIVEALPQDSTSLAGWSKCALNAWGSYKMQTDISWSNTLTAGRPHRLGDLTRLEISFSEAHTHRHHHNYYVYIIHPSLTVPTSMAKTAKLKKSTKRTSPPPFLPPISRPRHRLHPQP